MSQQPDSPPWWQQTTVYQIYPRSFFDSNGDGIGDLPGILAKLDTLVELGVQTLWISPFFASPQRDFGYDISDHYRLAPEYGTLADCQALLEAAHARGLKVVLDMVLNHTSDEHPWFVDSRSGRHSKHRDFYIWRRGRKPGGAAPPNNWRSLIGPRGWQYDAASDEWYFASFLPFQPDLNYRNPAVQEAMLGVVRHWLGQGFDGLRLDIFNCLFKDERFADNPLSLRPLPSEDNPDGFFQSFRYTVNHPDTIAFARTLRRVVDEFGSDRTGDSRFLVGEVFGPPSLLRRYCQSPEGSAEDRGLHLVFLFRSLRTPLLAPALHQLIAEYEHEFPAPLLPTYVFGNHDRARCGERLGEDRDRERLLATLQLTVRGVPFVYYGEELGMRNLDLRLRDALDPLAAGYRWLPDAVAHALRRRGILLNRDECRSPLPWSAAEHGGFTRPEATPWLPLHPRYRQENLAAQQADPDSLWSCYKRLLSLRAAQPALHRGSLQLLPPSGLPAEVLGFRRFADGKTLEVLLNCSPREQAISLPSRSGELLFSTHRSATALVGNVQRLRPYEGIVVEAG